jgi:hypothetical protein
MHKLLILALVIAAGNAVAAGDSTLKAATYLRTLPVDELALAQAGVGNTVILNLIDESGCNLIVTGRGLVPGDGPQRMELTPARVVCESAQGRAVEDVSGRISTLVYDPSKREPGELLSFVVLDDIQMDTLQ